MEVSLLADEKILPFLFIILAAFIVFNFILTQVLLRITGSDKFRSLSIYWISLFFVFLIHGFFQKGEFEIAISFSAAFLPMAILSNFLLSTYNMKFPWKKYMPFFLLCYPLSYALYRLSYSFTIIALPFSIVVGTPLIHAAYITFIKNKENSTTFQKFVGGFFLFMPIHCVDYAFLRMMPGAQLWGWLVSFSIYQFLAVILPLFTLEEIARNENIRIENLIKHYKKENQELLEKIKQQTS